MSGWVMATGAWRLSTSSIITGMCPKWIAPSRNWAKGGPVGAGVGGVGIAVGVGEGVLYGHAHVWDAELGLRRAVHEAHNRVDDALRVDYHFDVVVGHAEEPVGLDDLQALVHQAGR